MSKPLPSNRDIDLMAACVSAFQAGKRPRIDGRYLTAEELDVAEEWLDKSDSLMDEIERAENDTDAQAA